MKANPLPKRNPVPPSHWTPPASPVKCAMAKREFMVAYVLTRAAEAGGGYFDGKSSAEKSAKAWAVIEKECGGCSMIGYGSGTPCICGEKNTWHKKCYQDQSDELESLRVQLKEAQKELENERARSIHTCGPNCQRSTCVNRQLAGQLAASQAREQQLREALAAMVSYAMEEEKGLYIADKALALPQDTTVIEAMIHKAGEVMRERCDNVVDEGTAFVPFQSREHFQFASDRCRAIRALPGVTMEDLK